MTAPKKEPLPSPDVKATFERHLGGATWDDYKSAFKKTECSNLITTSQHSRLLEHHPNKDKLKSWILLDYFSKSTVIHINFICKIFVLEIFV